MPEINVTFAEIPLRSPFVSTDSTLEAIRNSKSRSPDAILLPPLTSNWLNRLQEPNEVLPNNDAGTSQDDAEWLLRDMNAVDYLDFLSDMAKQSSSPVIAGLSFSNKNHWVPYARRVAQAGATGIELRVMEYGLHLRSDQIEKRAIRTVTAVVDALDTPVIVRVKPSVTGLSAFTQALCDAGAKGIIIEMPRITRLTDAGLLVEHDNPLVPIEDIRKIYRRIPAHLAVDIGSSNTDIAISGLLAGATAIIHTSLDRSNSLKKELSSWMKEKDHDTIFDFRGSLSQSRLSASITT